MIGKLRSIKVSITAETIEDKLGFPPIIFLKFSNSFLSSCGMYTTALAEPFPYLSRVVQKCVHSSQFVFH